MVLSATVAAHAQAVPPAEAIAAIQSGNLLPDFQNEYLEAVNSTNIWQHDVKLSHEIGPRLRGTPAETEAVEWAAEVFESYGLDTDIEKFSITGQAFADVVPSRYTDEYASWQFRPATNGVFTGQDSPVTGQVLDIGSTVAGLADQADISGKVVLANWNTDGAVRTALLTELKAAGAAAVVLTKTDATSAPESLPAVGRLGQGLTDMVVVGSANNQGKRIRALLASGELSLTIRTDIGSNTSRNAIGVLPAANGDPEAPIIYLGAHIDSTLGSPGASDNGSGVSILLEIARIMSMHSYDAEIRFGVWGAEESGYQGSTHHVKTVMTKEEQARTLGAWNMDMAGTAYEGNPGQPFGFWALTADTNRQPLAPHESPVLDFSNQVSVLSGNGDLPIGTVSRSDHQPFHDVGIKAAVFSWMYWAGGTNIVLEPAYHQTTDTLEFVSEPRMAHAARILGGGAFRAALNEAELVVSDERGDLAADTPVAMSCTGDEGWRDAGRTDAAGKLTALAPNTTCDFVALADNGARALVSDVKITAEMAELRVQLTTNSAPTVELVTVQEPSASGWFQTAPVTVSILAANGFGDELSIEHSADGAVWVPYTDHVDLAEQGTQQLFVRASDGFGNTTEVTETIRLDSVVPVLQVTADPQQRGLVTGVAADETSGISLIQYRTGAGDWVTVPLHAAAPAAHSKAADPRVAAQPAAAAARFELDLKLGAEATTVQFRAVDVAGNEGSAGTLSFAAVPAGLSKTGGEAPLAVAVAAAALLLMGGGAMLVARRGRAERGEEIASSAGR